jgi:uncharacterized RDD family membrane protein YckC
MLAQMPADRTEIMTVAHLCACGRTVPIDLLSGGRCSYCERWYSPDVVDVSGGDTVCGLVSEDEDLRPAVEGDRPEDDPFLGRRLGHFRIVAQLGRGGMGSVYRALDESLQRYVALKVIRDRPDKDGTSPHVARLLQEARAQARVNHAHVVHIYYVSREEQTPFLAMELVHGPTLADRLRQGPLPFAEVISLAIQITEALHQAAQFDIVHGDIKPGNILLSDGVAAKLSDFGLSRRLSAGGVTTATVAGTPNYLSPEACRGEPTDVRSDMYALGVMLFEMTFGRLPYRFEGDGPQARLRAHCESAPEFPEPWPDNLPEGWRDVLGRLLEKNAQQRYWTYELLLDDLRMFQPVSLPKAGRLVRGLAWCVDILLASMLQRVLLGLFEDGHTGVFLQQHPWLQAAASATGFLIPLLVCFLQGQRKTTPGKELLQIRIVDTYGLTPSTTRLALRAVMPCLFLWHFALQRTLDPLGLTGVGRLVGIAAVAALLVDVSFAVFRSDRRSLHDLFLDTQVVLDADPRRVERATPRKRP